MALWLLVPAGVIVMTTLVMLVLVVRRIHRDRPGLISWRP